MSTRRWSEIDVLYALGTVLVVFGHSHSSDWSTFAGTVLTPVISFIYTFHMPLFFFIAGFLFMNSGSLEKNGYAKWIGQKAARLLTPYIILSVVAIIPKYYLENHSFDGFIGYLVKAIFAPRVGVWGHFWFLPVLLLMYVIFVLWKSLLKKGSVPFILTCTALVSVALYFLPYSTEWFGFSDLKEDVIFFVLGIILNFCIKDLPKAQPLIVRVLWVVIGTAISIVFVHYWYELKAVMLLTAIVMISVCWQFASLIGKNRACEWLSSNNFTIYIYSWPFQSAAMAIAGRLELSWYITTILMFAVGIMVPILLIVAYKKLKFLNNRFFDLLLGVK